MINNIFCSKQKQKNQKDQNVSEWNHGWKTGTTKKHVLAYFQNFCWLTNSSIIFEWMLHHTIDHTMIFIYWLLFTFYITYTYNNTVRIDYFDAIHYLHVFHFTNNFFFFTEIFLESLKKRFNVKIHCEINVKLVIHEILWKENFTVYPSLYDILN